MQFKKQVFKNQQVRLDFMAYYGCQFENCAMVYSGFGPVTLTDCEFSQVQWVFSDAAKNTLEFLNALYHNDEVGKQIVMSVLQRITGNGTTAIKPSPEIAASPSPFTFKLKS